MRHATLVVFACVAVLFAAQPRAQGPASATSNRRSSRRRWPNGLKVILVPLAGAPVVSMVTYADVGSVDENQNLTGLAHIFEHMAFKAPPRSEPRTRQRTRRDEEGGRGVPGVARRAATPAEADEGRIKELEAAFAATKDEAAKYVDVGGSANCSNRKARRD